MESSCSEHPKFDEFVTTIAQLRNPDGGCPWDLEQTHASIAQNMIEEAYEAVDAIEHDDVVHLREELGDVLLQVVLQSQIAKDQGEFDIDDVCNDINAKIVRRHPHVFGDVESGSANDVIEMWDKIKLAEKSEHQGEALSEPSLLDSVSANFPALLQAQKISRKAFSVGFEWDSIEDVWAKVDEEISELKEAYRNAPKDANGKIEHSNAESTRDVELEFGDVLFTLVNVARKMGINAEESLRQTCNKFRHRWEHMEKAAKADDILLEDLEIDRLEELWQNAKLEEN